MLTKENLLNGSVLLVNKPLHWTSFDAVRKIRNTAQIKKVGHAGTLDPLATGVLIVCTGKYTKKINEYMGMPKEYTGTITLGATTPTYDLESEPTHMMPYSHITKQDVYNALPQFIGNISQVPPIYSAIKVKGQTAYNLARKGQHIVMEPRQVTIYAFEITAIEMPILTFNIICSTGTYIRSMAHDLGQALGCGGYLSSLCRTRIGEYTVSKCLGVDEIVAQINAAKVPNEL